MNITKRKQISFLILILLMEHIKEKKDYFAEWGLDGTLVSTQSNDRPYYWYVDQGNTGTCSGVNCGPASTTIIPSVVSAILFWASLSSLIPLPPHSSQVASSSFLK